VNREAQFLASRVAKDEGPDPKAEIERAFRLVLSRSPNSDEEAKVLSLFAKFPPPEALRQLGVVLLNTNEFLYQE
jgi:hypothetical protein